MEKEQTVNLGCATLILIALIVAMCTPRDESAMRYEMQMLRDEIQQLRRAVDTLTSKIDTADSDADETPTPTEAPTLEPTNHP